MQKETLEADNDKENVPEEIRILFEQNYNLRHVDKPYVFIYLFFDNSECIDGNTTILEHMDDFLRSGRKLGNYVILTSAEAEQRKIYSLLEDTHTLLSGTEGRFWCRKGSIYHIEFHRGQPFCVKKDDFETIFNFFMLKRKNTSRTAGPHLKLLNVIFSTCNEYEPTPVTIVMEKLMQKGKKQRE